MKSLLSLLLFLAIVMAGSSNARADSMEYVSAKKVYAPVVGCCYIWQDELAPALKIVEDNLCKNLRAKNCSTTVVGKQKYYQSTQWHLPISTTYDLEDSKGNITTKTGLGNLSIFYECPISWKATWLEESETYICSREVAKSDCSGRKNNEPCSNVGNPINVLDESKVQVETDYVNVSGSLSYVRTYRSDTMQWKDNWSSYIIDWNSSASMRPNNACFYDRHDSEGYCYRHTAVNKPYNLELFRGHSSTRFDSGPELKPIAIFDDRLTPIYSSNGSTSGWNLSNARNGATESYRLDGKLDHIVDYNGQITRLIYSDATTALDVAPVSGLLIAVLDHFENSMKFKYNEDSSMRSMIDPEGNETFYSYHENGLLKGVTYPGGGTKTYLYNEVEHVSGLSLHRALTGIVDENSGRYATFKYESGSASETMRGNGFNRYSVSLRSGSMDVVDPLGGKSIYSPITYSRLGSKKISRITRPSATGSGSVVASWTYDENLNVSKFTDFNGASTSYTYDLGRNLETARVEAVGTPDQRTVSTEWHSTFRSPLKITEPRKATTYVYDEQGRVISRTEQATADLTGAQGLMPALFGQPRVWSWSYDQNGQVLTALGPSSDETTYTYDSRGNMSTLTNSLGHQTTYSNYDKSGRVGKIVAPNGLITEFSYNPRGWLTAKSISDGVNVRTTSYEYDKVGQVKKVNFADGSTVAYVYDSAHRLTSISDNMGNSVHYTLDNAGNRISQNSLDPSGVLTSSIKRTYDTLGNLKQVTGAMK